MLSKLKTVLLAVLTMGVSILFGLWKHSQAARANEQLGRVKLGKKARERADKALIERLQREKEAQDAPVKDSDIDRFYN